MFLIRTRACVFARAFARVFILFYFAAATRFERNTTFSIPATKEQSDFEFLRNSPHRLWISSCKATHPLMKNLATRRMMQCLRIKPNVVPLPEAAGSLCLYGNNTKEVSGYFNLKVHTKFSFFTLTRTRGTRILNHHHRSAQLTGRASCYHLTLCPHGLPVPVTFKRVQLHPASVIFKRARLHPASVTFKRA